jgi:spore maturation protein CgeB
MKILFYQWHSFMNKGMERALKQLGMEYDVFFYPQTDWEEDEQFAEKLQAAVAGHDLVLSVNFSPIVSGVCEKAGIRYLSWIYDSPVHIRNMESMKNSCNDIYVFDRGMAEEYRKMGIAAKHMPLAVDTEVFAAALQSGTDEYRAQVALLGNLYQTEYNYMTAPLEQYEKGYLEGIISAQSKVYGGYLIPELLTDELLARMNRQYSRVATDGFQMGRRELEFLLAGEVTGRERYMAAALLSNHFDFALYSTCKDERLTNVRMHDYVDYYSVMPKVFAASLVNLNISLRTIRTGIPLRIIDILGCGGFVISNFQEEIAEYFVPGQDLEIYENLEDLFAKTKFYLEHDDVRRQIAQNGFEKVQRDFTFQDRLGRMISGATL